MTRHLKCAVVQAAPIPFDIGAGIEQACKLAESAIGEGAKLVAFGETFLGGYPIWLDEAPAAAMWDHPGTQALHALLLQTAVVADDPRLAPLQELVDESGAIVSIGAHERVRSSLCNNQLLFRPGAAPLDHRKLVPTHGERLIWTRGDGSTLNTHSTDWGRVGSLICWEHWMPLARAAMHNLGESVHVAAWPTVRESYAIASRHYAFEGRCFVLAAGTVLHRADLIDGARAVGAPAAAVELLHTMPDSKLQYGGSMVVSPSGEIIAEAGEDETMLMANIDLAEIDNSLTSLDVDGHYSRPDIFQLSVNRHPMPGVEWVDNEN